MSALIACLNPALDITYSTERLTPARSHRVAVAGERAGGKGVNVARVLRARGIDSVLVAPLGGSVGDQVRQDLEASSIAHAPVDGGGETRRTVTIVEESGAATVLSEPGPIMDEGQWRSFRAAFVAQLPSTHVSILSGSLPPGAPPDAYAQLVDAAAGSGVAAIVDAVGEPLLRAARAGAAVLKPNREELAATLQIDSPVAGARALIALGADTVVVSLGAEGAIAVNGSGAWHARLDRTLSGNPTGAGDAMVAALAAHVIEPLSKRLCEAVALSAAAVLHPLAGSFDADALPALRADVIVEELR